MATYETREGDVLDQICFDHYGRHDGTAEQVLDANPGLSAHPSILPSGVIIDLPDIAEPVSEQIVKLYD